MREIKFRAIHKLTKHWFEDIHIIYQDGEWFEDYRALEDGRPMNLDQVAIMQYTGLKDKDGVEIYEGDIVNNSGLWVLHSTDQLQYDKRIYGEGMIFVVNINITGVELRTKKDWNRNTRKDFAPNGCHGAPYVDNHTAWNLQKTLEVIGNIYENPELLGDSQ